MNISLNVNAVTISWKHGFRVLWSLALIGLFPLPPLYINLWIDRSDINMKALIAVFFLLFN